MLLGLTGLYLALIVRQRHAQFPTCAMTIMAAAYTAEVSRASYRS